MRVIPGPSLASRRLPLRALLIFAAAITLAAVTYEAIALVRGRAVESRRAVAAFSHVEARVNHESALGWRLIAEQRLSPEVTSELRRVRSEIQRGILEVERLDNDADDGGGVRPLYRAYDRNLEQELRLIAASDQAQAEQFDEKRVEPSLDALEDLLEEERLEHTELADRHHAQAQVGTAAALLGAALLVAWLFTRREQAQLVLKRLTRNNELILNSAGDGIFGIDRDGRITFVNPAGSLMTGYEVEELLGRSKHEMIHHTRPDGTPYPIEESPVSASLRDGTDQHAANEVYFRKDGSSFPVEFTITPIVEHDEVAGAVVVFKDITERCAVERAKDEFTSVVSHELRTPLTSIRGSLGLLESGVLGRLPPKGQRMVEIAVQNTDRLVRLINDILDIERIDSGTIDMHPEPCDAAALLEQAVQSVEQFAADAQVSLNVESEPVALLADPDRVLQTLTNLISNAVKFSAAGSTVRLSSKRQGQEVLFEVTDEGRGIPAENLETIFGRFAQVDASDSREKGGTGLGLAICRRIVEHHGGRIWVDSTLGAGSTFSFLLPAMSEERLADDEARSGDGPRVLVCDDDYAVVEVVGAMLEQRGYRVIPACSGEQALERAIAEPPDAILLDLLMPGMSGWETAAALKEHPATCQVPIVMLSVLSAADPPATGASVVEWLEKPLDEAALFGALGRAVIQRDEPFKVLLVEDDRDLADMLTASFTSRGIATFRAADGCEAIRLSQQLLPDLLVLDVGLPEKDGFQVVDWLRQHDRLSALPMVVYTARELDDADRDRLRLAEGTEFLTKGRVTPQEFEQRVMRLLGRLTADRTPQSSDERETHPVGR